jgi:NAD-dependent SIR2 family protein deacetylase
VAGRMRAGLVIPFLGAGVNLAERAADAPWQPPNLPSARELAEYLAKRGEYPETETLELLRVSLFMGVVLGDVVLYEALHEVFAADYKPNAVHRFLARLPRMIRAEGKPQLLVITTNYDDALERAFAEREEPFDLVYYEAKRLDANWGNLWHLPAGANEPRPIEIPNDYRELDSETPIILKIHGAIDRDLPDRDSFVITEDDYVNYMARSKVSQLAVLTARMIKSHCLFMGYSLQDWNLRVLLTQIWGERKLTAKSWAVQLPDPRRSQMSLDVERELWDDRGKVDLLSVPLDQYVEKLGEQLPDDPGEPP